MLRDINDALKNVQYVIITSKVTCGCDHSNAWDHFFIDAGGAGMGCTSRDLLQQLGRFRKLSEQEVIVLLSSNKDYRITSAETAHSNVMQELRSRRALLQSEYRTLLAYDVENKKGDLVLSPDWLSTVFAFNKAEQNVNFSFTLSAQAKPKGFGVLREEDCIQNSRECQQSMARVEEAELDLRKRIYKSINFLELRDIINECEAAINANESDNEIREKLSVCKLLSI